MFLSCRRKEDLLKAFFLACMVAVSLAPAFAHGRTHLLVGYFSLAPHSSDESKGAAIEYFKLLAKELKWDVEFELFPLARMLTTDRVDIVLHLGKNAEREKYFIFSEQPLMQMQGAVVVSSQNSLRHISSANDLMPLQIGVWNNGFKSQLIRTKGLKLVEESGAAIEKRVLEKIVWGRLDAFYNPETISLRYAVEKAKLSQKLKILPLPESSEPLYFAFRKNLAPPLIRNFNAVYAKFRVKRPYREFLDDYLKNGVM